MHIPPIPEFGKASQGYDLKYEWPTAFPKAPVPALPGGITGLYGWPSDESGQENPRVCGAPLSYQQGEGPRATSLGGETLETGDQGRSNSVDALARLLSQLSGRQKPEIRAVGIPPWPLLMNIPKWKEDLQSRLLRRQE